jgi:hypothetical protein
MIGRKNEEAGGYWVRDLGRRSCFISSDSSSSSLVLPFLCHTAALPIDIAPSKLLHPKSNRYTHFWNTVFFLSQLSCNTPGPFISGFRLNF